MSLGISANEWFAAIGALWAALTVCVAAVERAEAQERRGAKR